MGFLEAQIASKGNAFATGGSTTGVSGVVAGTGAELAGDEGAVVDLLQRLVKSHEEFREEITDWQRNLDVNLDPRRAKKAIDMATQVMSGGAFGS